MQVTMSPDEIDLLQRIGLADITESSSVLHDWKDLMGKDLERCGGADWLYRCYEKFTELGLLHKESGCAMGPAPFGRLSMRGRVLLEEIAAAGSE